MIHKNKLYVELMTVEYKQLDLTAIVYHQVDNVNDCFAIVNDSLRIEGTTSSVLNSLQVFYEDLREDKETLKESLKENQPTI